VVPFDQTVRRVVAVVTAFLWALSPASAEDVAGDFDFYVLALSWSPTYCTTESSPDEAQCGIERHGFIVHGLWPQYERGYPEFCRSSMSDRVSGSAAGAIYDIVPSIGLIRYQWRKHGICTGLSQTDYFTLTRLAFDKISIPDEYAAPDRVLTVSPAAIESAFVAANRGLSPRGIAVTCEQGHLDEVRICLTKDLDFRTCPEVDRNACRASRIAVPALQ
jgi:ribonuclease T2